MQDVIFDGVYLQFTDVHRLSLRQTPSADIFRISASAGRHKLMKTFQHSRDVCSSSYFNEEFYASYCTISCLLRNVNVYGGETYASCFVQEKSYCQDLLDNLPNRRRKELIVCDPSSSAKEFQIIRVTDFQVSANKNTGWPT